MYAFRKPFSAATYEGLKFFGSEVDLKTAFVISQLFGYALSKYIGIKVCSEMTRGRRLWTLAGLILAAEAALVLFGVLPGEWKFVALFFNGLPLGMVWGMVVLYLEGRQTSELLLAGLSCSFILGSGMVKNDRLGLVAAFGIMISGLALMGGSTFLLDAGKMKGDACMVCVRLGVDLAYVPFILKMV